MFAQTSASGKPPAVDLSNFQDILNILKDGEYRSAEWFLDRIPGPALARVCKLASLGVLTHADIDGAPHWRLASVPLDPDAGPWVRPQPIMAARSLAGVYRAADGVYVFDCPADSLVNVSVPSPSEFSGCFELLGTAAGAIYDSAWRHIDAIKRNDSPAPPLPRLKAQGEGVGLSG